MLRKELQKKMQAVAMAAVVTLTTVGAPATTFAGELPGELTAEAFSDNGEAVTEEVTEDDFSRSQRMIFRTEKPLRDKAAQEKTK